MKTKAIQLFAASFLAVMMACNNQTSEEKKPEPGNSTTVEVETKKAEEPKKTEVTVGPGGAEVKTKTGEEVKVSQSGGTVGTKDVKIKVNTKDTTKK